MTQTSNNPVSTDQPREASGNGPGHDPFVDVLGLVRGAIPAAEFLRAALRVVAGHFNSPYAALHVRYCDQVVIDDCHFGRTDPAFWEPSVQDFLTDSLSEPKARARLLQSRSGATRIAFLSAPIFDPSGPAIGAVALVTSQDVDRDVSIPLTRLEALCRFVSYAAEFLERHPERPGDGPREPEGGGAATNFRGVTASGGFGTVEELSFKLANEVCNKLGCVQTALGLVLGDHVRVVCVSGLDTVRSQSPGVVVVRSAMEECLDARTTVTSGGQGSEGGLIPDYHLHRKWQACACGDAVASMPLFAGNQISAIISLRRSIDSPFTKEELEEMGRKLQPFGPALVLLHRARRSLWSHAREAALEVARTLTRPGHWGRKVMAASLIAVVGVFCFGEMEYQLAVPCVVAPTQVRHLAAPFDGVIQSAPVTVGDQVHAGDVLFTVDSTEMEQQATLLRADLSVWERTRDQAMAEGNRTGVQLAQSHADLAKARLGIMERRIAQAVVRSPIDGTIVAGDLRPRVSGLVSRGEPLMEVAPLSVLRLELQVPDRGAADVQPELRGLFIPYSQPSRQTAFRIQRVLSAAQPRDGRNVFIAEAEIRTGSEEFRPGMEGVGRIQVGSRPIWWIVLHRAIDYARNQFWL